MLFIHNTGRNSNNKVVIIRIFNFEIIVMCCKINFILSIKQNYLLPLPTALFENKRNLTLHKHYKFKSWLTFQDIFGKNSLYRNASYA